VINETAPRHSDGRRRRSQHSRDRIVAAMMALVGEGQLSPIAEQVAERAGVGLRSVFRHFTDMDSLFAEMAAKVALQYQPALAPFAAEDWRGQLAEAIDRRIGIFEDLLPYKRAADAHRHKSPSIQATHDLTQKLLRARLPGLLPPHLADDADALETLDFLLSVESWQRLRVEQGLPIATARRIVEAQVTALTG
jgi:AcrR family transcriptional regulator